MNTISKARKVLALEDRYLTRQIRSITRTLAGVLLLACSLSAVASIEVSGSTISWPDDGWWYQVENRLTGEIVCQGGLECTVPEGLYWVSSFSPDGTRIRGSHVTIGNPAEDDLSLEDFAASISVDDLTISWSIGGWYQIQNAETMQEVCNGASECVVDEPGTYIVINHDIGRRVSVSVGLDLPTDPGTETPENQDSFASSLTVNDNTISWSLAGWYQVLDAITYSHVCGGGSSCTVPEEGRYIVINHDADLRAELYVGSDTPTYPDGITVNGNIISLPDDGWYQVQSSKSYETICEGTTTCEVDQPGRYIIVNHTTGERFEDIAVYWSRWLDRDNPSGTGDWETGFEEGLPCADPMDIQARVLGRDQIYSVGDTLPNMLTSFRADYGLLCENNKQTSGYCEDYEVRFYCPSQ